MPTHQIPLGATLSLPRRLKLIDWAQTTGTMIVEDYYDGDYRYEGRPIPALAALDKAGWVLYVGTFSKILFPSLRIGYVVVPERLIEIYAWAKKLDDNYSPMLEQAVLADFMNSGSLDKYMRQMCKTYKNKRLRLIQALEANFGESIQILGESAGLSLAVRFQTKLEDAVIITELANLGVGIAPTSKNYMAENYTKGEFFMGFGNIDEHLIEEGVKRMARVIIAPSH
jgi:GntR family transcriptional regulator/MocR family aminotransferase